MRRRMFRRVIPGWIQQLPADIAAVVVLTLLTVISVFLPGVRETPLRIMFGIPFILFLTGYTLIAALFPQASSAELPERHIYKRRDHGINGIERVVLSVGMSAIIVPLIGLVLNFTPWGIRLKPLMVSIGGFTIIAATVATVRRWKLSPAERYSVPYHEWIAAVRAEFFDPNDRTDAVLNVVLVLSLLFALGSVGFVVAVPHDSEQFTEFYLLTEDGDDELVADEYPEEFVQGEAQSVMVGIENHEYETVEYTVVVQLERVESNEAGSEVVERDELDRFSSTLEHEETGHREYQVVPTMAGEQLRLTFLLYDGDVPETPTRENAYRKLHLWIDVE